MLSKRAFIVGNEEKLKDCAEKLASCFYPGKSIQVVDFADTACFKGMTDEDMNSLVFLGHTDSEAYGGYTEKLFTKKLIKQFPSHKKHLLRHLYLIGCEVGLIHEGQSLAQQIVNDLLDGGFTNIRLHAIANPKDAVGDCMFVEVIEQVGLISFQKVKEGYINAYLINKADSDRLLELSQNENKHVREINKIKLERTFTFIRAANPAEELKKPYHIFLPYESPQARESRIEKNPHTRLCAGQIHALTLLKERREYERKKKNQPVWLKLNFIITQLERVQPEAWLTTMQEFVAYFKIKIMGMTVNGRSNTLKLLECIEEQNFEKAEKIIKSQEVKLIRTENKMHQGEHSKAARTESSVARMRHHETFAESPGQNTLHHILQLLKAKEKINALMKVLEEEIEGLCQSCFSFFHRFEINTKTKKKNALQPLLDVTTFDQLQMLASDLILNDTRVMRSQKTTRTRDLLNTIVYSPECLFEGDLVSSGVKGGR